MINFKWQRSNRETPRSIHLGKTLKAVPGTQCNSVSSQQQILGHVQAITVIP